LAVIDVSTGFATHGLPASLTNARMRSGSLVNKVLGVARPTRSAVASWRGFDSAMRVRSGWLKRRPSGSWPASESTRLNHSRAAKNSLSWVEEYPDGGRMYNRA
jgi:hypothetical protein